MKYCIAALLTMSFTTLSWAEPKYSIGAKLGIAESYHKKILRNDTSKIDGNFKGNSLGLVAKLKQGPWSYYLEYTPEADTEVSGEKALVETLLLGAEHQIWAAGPQSLSAGLFIADASFELERGPGGVTFADNPTADGSSYGLSLSYDYPWDKNWSLGGGLRYGLGDYSGKGAASTPVDTIEVDEFYQLNLMMLYNF